MALRRYLQQQVFAPFAIGIITVPGLISNAHASETAFQESVLHSFGGPDGAGALFGVIADARGNLYGTTVFGGDAGFGDVFELSPGRNGYKEKVLYTFSGGNDGSKPDGGLVADKHGAFYGVTALGGSANCGTVFKLKPGKKGYTESVLYSFRCSGDGSQPVGTPVLDKNGAVYGVTQFSTGFDTGGGVVFALTPSQSGYTQSVLYTFPGDAGGDLPQAGLTIDSHESLYGTTYYGGEMNDCEDSGCGVVFSLARTKSGFVESVLYAFKNVGGSDGDNPSAAPAVDGRTGAIFGTTEYGGVHEEGAVYELMPTRSGYSETLLHSFSEPVDGYLPTSQILVGPHHKLYGTISLGDGGCGNVGCGGVYQLKSTPRGYVFKTIYGFGEAINGAEPDYSSLIMDASGSLYGTTRSGGTKTGCSDGGPGGVSGCGVVFKLAR
jgi:uncharacterized repeat protein (TIGR03803 family)